MLGLMGQILLWALCLFQALVHRASALEMLSPLGLALRKEASEFNSSVPIGSILRQTPPPGIVVREGKIIRVVVSQGGETVFVPNLVGLPLRNAELLLRQRQLLLGEVSESYSLHVEKGMVLSQDPNAESSAMNNALVSTVISAGPPPLGITLMPDFRQKQIQEASHWAKEGGFSIRVSSDRDSLFPNGIVLSQQPQPDVVVSRETEIKFVVSGNMKGTSNPASMKHLHYEVSQGGSDSLIRIVLVDQSGEREVFNGLRAPGSKVDLDIPQSGSAKVRIFVNGILVEEREIP
ncbi:MAG: PASTA domain-containing protein [Elusimicrobia bacterium]|nr:PASTA domain-containing protein [Elusimicrobiota bacterium]